MAGWPWLASPDAGGMVEGPGLRAARELGEGQREGDVGLRVAVVVDVDPVDRAGVEIPAGDDLRGQLDGGSDRRVRIDEQDRLPRVLCRLECEHVGEVQARVVAGKPELVCTEVVGYGDSLSGDVVRPGVVLRWCAPSVHSRHDRFARLWKAQPPTA